MKFLKKFATRAEYDAFMATNENYPFVGYIADEGVVEYANPVNYAELPLHFIAEEDMTVSFTNPLQYSLDNETWMQLAKSTATQTISAGNKVYFRASGLTPTSTNGIGTFSATGRFQVAGNVKSMLLGDNFIKDSEMPNNAFRRLFAESTITDARNLIIPYATMADSGCMLMFKDCAILHTAPKKLPATTLADSCYFSMFNNCTSLVNAPALPATTLANYCYKYMFNNCTSLVNAPALPATTLANYCYEYMFDNCTSLVNAPALPATTLVSSCYKNMFDNCTSLVNAPALPATTLVSSCYKNMFDNCTSLEYIKAMFTTAPAPSYSENWVSGVKSNGTFVKNVAATWDVTGVYGIPSGWIVELATE